MKKSKGPNKTALRQLRRVVKAAPRGQFDMRDACKCMVGFSERDKWFSKRGCLEDVLGLSGEQMWDLIAVKASCNDALTQSSITKAEVLANIDRLLAGKRALVYKALRS